MFVLYMCMQYSLVCLPLFTWMLVSVYVKEDISRLIEEGRLEFKLNELDKLERAVKNSPDAAWSVNSIKNLIYWLHVKLLIIYTQFPCKTFPIFDNI